MINDQDSRQIANTIIEQLGGRTFKLLTGAKDFSFARNKFGETYLQFKLPRNKSKGNFVRVTLEQSDTYKMEFIRFRKNEITTLDTVEGLYFDMLMDTFEEKTGLYVTLKPRK